MAIIKKIILLALTAITMVGCVNDGKVVSSNFVIVELDSCEYGDIMAFNTKATVAFVKNVGKRS